MVETRLQNMKENLLRNIYIYIYIYRIGLASLAVAFAMVLSGFFVSASAFAEAGQGVQFTVGIDETPVMEITLKTTELYLGLSPQMASADFSETDFSVTVGTSNKTGYNLNMTATSTNLTRTQAISGETPVMQTLDEETSAADFTTNRWGFRKGLLTDEDPTYLPVALTNQLASNEEATNGITTNLVFAAKADASQPAGDYTTTLNFIATANPTVTYIQDLDPTLCTKADSLTVVDSRDGQEYTVQRLNDGKCWMTKNLNLAGESVLSANDTDVDSTYISGFTTQAGLTKDNNTITLPASATITSGTSVDSTQFSSDTTAYVFNSGNTTCSSSSPCYSYYSWIAATLGGKQANGSTAVANYYNAAASICPKGWRLPTSTTSNGDAQASNRWKTGDFYALAKAYGANLESQYYQNSGTFTTNAGPGTTPNFLLTGYYYGGSFIDGGRYGLYWSSTSYSSTYAYSLDFNSSYVYSANHNVGRRGGFGVRCILRETRTPENLQYLQDMNSEIAANMDSTKAYTLKDSRDNQEYTIKKLADGKVWMMTNLNLGATTLTTDLTGANTNLSNTVTAATFNGWKKTSGSASYTAAEYIPITASNSYTGSATDPTSQTAYGTLYNYCAASAGTICTSSNSSNASYDLCPAGWRLPTGNTSGEFQALYGNSNYNTNAKMRAPETNNGAAFALAGSFYNAAPTNQGSYGYYWSSTRYGSTSMYYLTLNTSSVNPASYNGRDDGFSIRCVLK